MSEADAGDVVLEENPHIEQAAVETALVVVEETAVAKAAPKQAATESNVVANNQNAGEEPPPGYEIYYVPEDPVEILPQKVANLHDEFDRNKLPYVKRPFDPLTPSHRDFKATLHTTLEFGYNLRVSGNPVMQHLIVVEVAAGSATKWNQLYPDRAIKPGDRIISVNGVTDTTFMVDELRASVKAVLFLRRPITYTVIIDKPIEGKLGVSLNAISQTFIWVDKLAAEGCFVDWNIHNPLHKVTTGTRILEVNGIQGSDWILEELKAPGRKEILVEGHGPETVNPQEPAYKTLFDTPAGQYSALLQLTQPGS